MFGGKGLAGKEYSEQTSYLVDKEISKIMDRALERTGEVLDTHKKALENITKRLIEVETIEREDFENLLIANGITPKK